MEIISERLILKTPEPSFAPMVLDYYKRNKDFLEPFESKKPDNFFTSEFIGKLLIIENIKVLNNESIRFYLFKKDEPHKIIGTISISNIIRGAFQSAFMGYKLDKKYINQGYITEGIIKVIDYAFNSLLLHRIEVCIMPKNAPSLKIMEKLNFNFEGLAKNYLEINGSWQDHFRFSLINPNSF